MNFRDYYQNLTSDQRTAYANRAGTTIGYIESHLLSRRKIPKRPTMNKLVKASRGKLTLQDLLNHFYQVA